MKKYIVLALLFIVVFAFGYTTFEFARESENTYKLDSTMNFLHFDGLTKTIGDVTAEDYLTIKILSFKKPDGTEIVNNLRTSKTTKTNPSDEPSSSLIPINAKLDYAGTWTVKYEIIADWQTTMYKGNFHFYVKEGSSEIESRYAIDKYDVKPDRLMDGQKTCFNYDIKKVSGNTGGFTVVINDDIGNKHVDKDYSYRKSLSEKIYRIMDKPSNKNSLVTTISLITRGVTVDSRSEKIVFIQDSNDNDDDTGDSGDDIPDPANIKITGFSCPGSCNKGDDIQVSFVVKNLGEQSKQIQLVLYNERPMEIYGETINEYEWYTKNMVITPGEIVSETIAIYNLDETIEPCLYVDGMKKSKTITVYGGNPNPDPTPTPEPDDDGDDTFEFEITNKTFLLIFILAVGIILGLFLPVAFPLKIIPILIAIVLDIIIYLIM